MGASKPDPKKLSTTVTDGPGGTSGGSSTGDLYGLKPDVQAQLFDVSGIPGLGSGQMSGGDILRRFLALGQSTDPNAASLRAAIQQALYFGYKAAYGSHIPVLGGEITGDDAKVLGVALTDLFNANKAQVGGTASGQTQPMKLVQFLTSQANLGATGGPNAPGQAVAQVFNVRAPNAADVAASYQKVAQQLLGHRPDAADTAAFVNSYTQQYVSNEKANIQSQYDATVQKAQVKAQATGAAPYLPSVPTVPTVGPGTILHPGGGPNAAQLGMGAGDVPPPDLADSMGTLQDVINAQAQSQQAAPQLIEAGTNAPEDAGVAAENFARNQHPREAAAGDLNDTFGTFLSLIGAHMAGV